MSYQSNLEGSPMIVDFAAADDTPKSEKKSLGRLTSVLVLFLALASFLAGRSSSSGSTSVATATVSSSAAATAFDEDKCRDDIWATKDPCGDGAFQCLYVAAMFQMGVMEDCPYLFEREDCVAARDTAMASCA